MAIGLRRMLAKHRDPLIDSVAAGLKESDSVRYQQIDPQLLRGRVEHLVDAFLEAIDPAAILETVRTGASGILAMRANCSRTMSVLNFNCAA